jgi:hypothetical protein
MTNKENIHKSRTLLQKQTKKMTTSKVMFNKKIKKSSLWEEDIDVDDGQDWTQDYDKALVSETDLKREFIKLWEEHVSTYKPLSKYGTDQDVVAWLTIRAIRAQEHLRRTKLYDVYNHLWKGEVLQKKYEAFNGMGLKSDSFSMAMLVNCRLWLRKDKEYRKSMEQYCLEFASLWNECGGIHLSHSTGDGSNLTGNDKTFYEESLPPLDNPQEKVIRRQYIALVKDIAADIVISPYGETKELLRWLIVQHRTKSQTSAQQIMMNMLMKCYLHEVERSKIIDLTKVLKRQMRSDFNQAKYHITNIDLMTLRLWLECDENLITFMKDQCQKNASVWQGHHDIWRIQMSKEKPTVTTMSLSQPILKQADAHNDALNVISPPSSSSSYSSSSSGQGVTVSPVKPPPLEQEVRVSFGKPPSFGQESGVEKVLEVTKILSFIRKHGTKPNRCHVVLTSGEKNYFTWEELEKSPSFQTLWKQYKTTDLIKQRAETRMKRRVSKQMTQEKNQWDSPVGE